MEGSTAPSLPDRSRLGWWVLALFVAALAVAVLRRFLGVLAFAIFLYYVGRPVTRRFEGVVGSRRLAASLTFVVILLPFGVILGVVAAIAFGQVFAVVDGNVEALLADAVPGVDATSVPENWSEAYALSVEYVQFDDATRAFETLLDLLTMVAVLTFEVTLLSVIVFLLLYGDRDLEAWFRDAIASPGTASYGYLRAVDEELQRIYVGQLVTMFAVILLAWVLYAALGYFAPSGLSLPYPLVLALLSGVATFVPVIGRSLVYVPIGIIFAVQALRTDPASIWYAAVAMLSGWFVLDPAVRYGARPYLTSFGVSPGLMLIAYVSSATLFGWYGIFLAPLLLVGTLEFLDRIFPALVHGEPIAAPDEDGDGGEGGGGEEDGTDDGSRTETDTAEADVAEE